VISRYDFILTSVLPSGIQLSRLIPDGSLSGIDKGWLRLSQKSAVSGMGFAVGVGVDVLVKVMVGVEVNVGDAVKVGVSVWVSVMKAWVGKVVWLGIDGEIICCCETNEYIVGVQAEVGKG
jgi:hypothetical protein